MIYGFAGQCMEILFTGTFSLIKGDSRLVGNSSLWMFPIYGSAVLLEPVHNSIRMMPFFYRGIVYLVLIWVTEYASGWLIRRMVGVCPWDYEEHSLDGLIRWDFAPAWFAVGLLFEPFHDFLMTIFP